MGHTCVRREYGYILARGRIQCGVDQAGALNGAAELWGRLFTTRPLPSTGTVWPACHFMRMGTKRGFRTRVNTFRRLLPVQATKSTP